MWGWYLAWSGSGRLESPDVRLKSVQSLPVETTYLTAEILRAAFTFGKEWLTPTDGLMVNTKLRPVMVRYYQRSWKD